MNPIPAIPLTPSLLGMQGAGSEQGSRSAKLHKAAQDFGALMIGEMLKSTRESGSDGGWLGSGDSPGNDSAMALAETQLAQAIAKGGGLGLAQMIEKQLAPAADSSGSDQNKNASSGVPSAGAAK